MAWRRLFILAFPFILGGLVVGGWWYLDEKREAETCTYSLINPTRCENERRFSNPEYEPTRKLIEQEIATWKGRDLSSMAVSFRDLRNGPSFTIDQGEVFLAMSLFKLPVMIRYLKDAEGDPRILDEKITVALSSSTTNQNLTPNETLTDGQQYPIRQLLEKMIKYSDNHSRAALADHYAESTHQPGYDVVVDTLTELGIVDAAEMDDDRLISLRSIASIFRILYNASYLNIQASHQALEWLSQSAYDDGIAAPIPPGITVANKYGLATEGTMKQLHDCGIIYYPEHPYSLCIMSKGEDLQILEEAIASISQIIYQEVDRRYEK